jgi:micrococcal nuclease
MTPFTYNATVVRVVDGDTVDVDIDLGFGIWFRNQRIRLLGVDTPECRTTDDLEKRFGMLAKSVVETLCPVGAKIIVQTELDDKGKFGRVLGILMVQDATINLNEFLITERYAVAYHGQAKSDIEEAHLANYAYLTENGKI